MIHLMLRSDGRQGGSFEFWPFTDFLMVAPKWDIGECKLRPFQFSLFSVILHFRWLSISLYLYNSLCFLFCIGHAWTTDYGCSDKEEEFQWLIKYGCSDFLLFPTSLYTIWVAALLLYRHWTDYWAAQKIIKPLLIFFFSNLHFYGYQGLLIKGY